jgi:hypothetical protein
MIPRVKPEGMLSENRLPLFGIMPYCATRRFDSAVPICWNVATI